MRRGFFGTALLALGSCLLLTLPTIAQSVRKGQPLSDEQFVKMASAENLVQIDLAKLAVKQSTSADVRKFAKEIMTDHTKLNKDLTHLANTKTYPIATALNKRQRKLADKLASLHGAAFDHEFMKHMVDYHKKAVTLFEHEAKNGQNTAVKEFASKTLPTLREHLEAARKITGVSK